MADAVEAIDSCCADIKSTERELFQPNALAAWCFMRAAFLIARFFRVYMILMVVLLLLFLLFLCGLLLCDHELDF